MIHFKLAFRNTFKNTRRTLLTLLSISVGISAIILYKGFILYSMWGLQENSIRNGLGHIQLASSYEYFETGEYDPYNFLINNYEDIVSELKEVKHVKEVVPKLSFPATLASSSKSGITMIHAIPADNSIDLLSFRNIVEGRDIKGEGAYEMILGQGLAKKLSLKVGDVLTLMAVMKGGGLNAVDMDVVGFSSSGIREIDNMYSYIDLETAKMFLGIENVPQLIVLLDETDNMDATLAVINSNIKDKNVVTKTWVELSDYYKQVKDFYKNILDVVRFIILTIVIFAIINTITMSVLERVREIGTLRAIGAKKIDIISMFLQEAAIIGFIGGLVGALIALIVSGGINVLGGVYISPPPGMTEGYYAYFPVSVEAILDGMILSFFISILGAIYPALKSVKLSVANSLRYT